MRVSHFGPVCLKSSAEVFYSRPSSAGYCPMHLITFRINFYGEFMRLMLLILLFSSLAKASVIFEGYYKVSQFNNHIGFIVIKHELEPKTNNYIIHTFLRLAKKNFDMTETLMTVSDANMKPVRYSYTAMDKKKSKTIEGTITTDTKTKKEVLAVLAIEDGKKISVSVPYEKGVFFSSALYPTMLRGEKGLKTNMELDFNAIAEEVAQVHTGKTKIAKARVTKDTFQLMKAFNDFAGSSYEVLLTDKGEIVSTNDSKTGIKTELMRNKEEAIQDIKINNKTLEQVFGSIPEGKTNSLNVKK